MRATLVQQTFRDTSQCNILEKVHRRSIQIEPLSKELRLLLRHPSMGGGHLIGFQVSSPRAVMVMMGNRFIRRIVLGGVYSTQDCSATIHESSS